MPKLSKTFDPKCHELACMFLMDDPELAGRADALAAEIQEAVESWIDGEMATNVDVSEGTTTLEELKRDLNI